MVVVALDQRSCMLLFMIMSTVDRRRRQVLLLVASAVSTTRVRGEGVGERVEEHEIAIVHVCGM